MLYKGENTREISFPLGGIGTGCIGLAGNGRLIDWEIYNRPNKGSVNGISHFAVKAESAGRVLDARVLNGDYIGSRMGSFMAEFASYGFGVERAALTGVPHFRDAEFLGEFPLAEIRFADETFPGKVSMKAFNPFIPTNDRDSTIPAAFFELTVSNTTREPLQYTFAATLGNPLPLDGALNEYVARDGLHMIHMRNAKLDPKSVDYGEMSLATDSGDISYQEYLYRGGWYDNLGIFWNDFTAPGRFKNRRYPHDADKPGMEHHRHSDLGTLAAHVEVAPGERKSVRFIISWNFPNCYNYWKKQPDCDCGGYCEQETKTWKNYYAVLFGDSMESASYALGNWDRLESETRLFKDALFGSTLPDYVTDAISANISILKSPTVLRLEGGEFYGWEGCHCQSGCCEGSCTHVWNYAYALPYLFPSLERSMHDLDYKYSMREDGGMPFRLQLPIGSEMSGFRPCADGQFGNIMKTYRDWKISGDTQWLRDKWPALKKAIEFAWSEENTDLWDPDKAGILTGRQHHTLDMELFGPNAWLTGFYLGALKAGAEMAAAMDDTAAAREYREIFERGKQRADKELWNGEYYIQRIDLKDKSVVERFSGDLALTGVDTLKAYWNDESNEIKYQMGEGSAADQLLAQWHANLMGLGELLDKSQTKKALSSIFKYNFKRRMREVFNPCRIYANNDESGTVICDWPEGTYKPLTPAPYCEECWPGIEYPVGALMIQEGLVDEGLAVVKAVRDRFDGTVRNPWNEFECGSNYARSMASYSLLNALSGFVCDMVTKTVGFSPAIAGDCQFFFSLGSGWGTLARKGRECSVLVRYGSLRLTSFSLPEGAEANTAEVDGAAVAFRAEGNRVVLEEEILLQAGSRLTIR